MYNKILFFVGFLLLFQSCGQTENDLKETFTKVKNHENWEDVLNNIDKESHDYLTQIAELANSNNDGSISDFCSKQKFPLTTKFLIKVMTKMSGGENSFEKKDVLVIAALSNTGLIGLESKDLYSFHKLDSSGSGKAIAIANYLVQRKPRISVQSKFQFSEEDGQWKLNLPSTYSYGEKYYKKLWQQRGGTEDEFIQSVIDTGGGEVQFQYRADRAN